MSRFRLALAVVDYFPFGGMQRTFFRVAQEAARRGHDVRLFAATWSGEKPEGAQIELLPVEAGTNHGRNEEFGRRVHARLHDLEEHGVWPYDCIVAFQKIGECDVYYAGDPCYAARSNDGPTGFLRRLTPRYWTYRALEAAVFDADSDTEILLISPSEEARFRSIYGTPSARFHHLPPGIDRERLRADGEPLLSRRELRARHGIAADAFLLLNIGAQFRTKGVDRILEAAAWLSPAAKERLQILIVGGDDSAPYEALARARGLADRVHFAGAQQDVGSYLRAADLLVHPARLENTGTTLLEALVLGCPVLAAGLCGYAFHIEAAAAGLVLAEPHDRAAWTAAIERAMTTDEPEKWSEYGRRYGRNIDLYGLVPRAVDVIEKRAAANRDELKRDADLFLKASGSADPVEEISEADTGKIRRALDA